MTFQMHVVCVKCGEKGYLSVPNELPTPEVEERLREIRDNFCCPYCMASMTHNNNSNNT